MTMHEAQSLGLTGPMHRAPAQSEMYKHIGNLALGRKEDSADIKAVEVILKTRALAEELSEYKPNHDYVADTQLLYGVTLLSRTVVSDDPDNIARVYLVRGKRKDVQRFTDENYPHTYCQHEYDCCGRYYRSHKASIRKVDKYDETLFAIYDTMYRNV